MYSKIHEQIALLNTKIRFFERKKVKHHLEALDQIGEFGSPSDAKYILKYIHSPNKLISQKTATVIRKLLIKREIKTPWLKLYSTFFHYSTFDLSNEKTLKLFESFSVNEAAHLYGIASLNQTGYLREKALDYLQALPTAEVLPYVFLRLNDWVSPVQIKAREALARILPSISVTELIKYYTLIEWLGKTERVDLQDVQNKIYEQIHNSSNRQELFKAMQKASFRERLFCWKALADELAYDNSLIDQAIADPAPEIRQWALGYLPKTDGFKDRLDTLLSDPAVRVRYAALKAIPQDSFSNYKDLLVSAIFDNSKPIREYARFILRSNAEDNHANRYRQKLLEKQDRANLGLIAGLGETGSKEDIVLLKKFVNHKNAKIRASTLAGLNNLKADNLDNLYLLGLQDNSAKVRNTCVSILQSGYNHLSQKLKGLLASTNFKSQKAALEVLTHFGGLDSLYAILFSLTLPHEELHKMAWQTLNSWHHKYAAKPWFNLNSASYKQALELLDTLRQECIEPPDSVRRAWNELSFILKAKN